MQRPTRKPLNFDGGEHGVNRHRRVARVRELAGRE